MRKINLIVYTASIILVLIGCKKTEDKSIPKQEEKINFQLNPDDTAGSFNLNVDSLDLAVSIVSAIPDSGVYVQIQAKRKLDDKVLLKLIRLLSKLNFKQRSTDLI